RAHSGRGCGGWGDVSDAGSQCRLRLRRLQEIAVATSCQLVGPAGLTSWQLVATRTRPFLATALARHAFLTDTSHSMRERQPPGLYVLFFTEMWERFGFYTMVGMFTLYLQNKDQGFGWSDT